ncbi:MAG: hypothetical protein ABI324_19515 [Ktedonobacteraceae bacterium]
MDVPWNYLGIFCIGLSIFMIISSMHIIIGERKKLHHLADRGETILPWYMNATIRKHCGLLLDGVLLIVVTAGLAFLLKHVALGSLMISAAIFLHSCFTFVSMVAEEAERRRIAQETRKDLSR